MVDVASLARALAERADEVEVFIRDDDGGWGDAALERLTRAVLGRGVELDVAVIPEALTGSGRALLSELLAHGAGKLHVHQHGRAHVNRERTGRKCEFGATRSLECQRDDIARGAALMREAFGNLAEPIFTPPWNRCNRDTVRALRECGLRVLSRESEAAAFGDREVVEVPVHVDWLKRRAGARLVGTEFGDYLAAPFRAEPFVGIMLHHAAMTPADCADVLAVIDTLQAAPKVRFTSISALAERIGNLA
jgi:predicted deacetylase